MFNDEVLDDLFLNRKIRVGEYPKGEGSDFHVDFNFTFNNEDLKFKLVNEGQARVRLTSSRYNTSEKIEDFLNDSACIRLLIHYFQSICPDSRLRLLFPHNWTE